MAPAALAQDTAPELRLQRTYATYPIIANSGVALIEATATRPSRDPDFPAFYPNRMAAEPVARRDPGHRRPNRFTSPNIVSPQVSETGKRGAVQTPQGEFRPQMRAQPAYRVKLAVHISQDQGLAVHLNRSECAVLHVLDSRNFYEIATRPIETLVKRRRPPIVPSRLSPSNASSQGPCMTRGRVELLSAPGGGGGDRTHDLAVMSRSL